MAVGEHAEQALSGRPLAVMQVVDALPAGGKERVAVQLANGLAKLGCASHLLASRGGGPLLELVSADVHAWCAGRRSRFDVGGLVRIARYIDRHRIDVVHSHNHSSAYLMQIARRLARRTPVHVVHDHHGPAAGDRSLDRTDRLMLRDVDLYLAVSEPLRDRARRLLALPEDRCVYLRNGVAVGPVPPPWAGPPTVIQVANLVPPKGHATAVRAAAALRRSLPSLRWICVGREEPARGAYAREVRRLIEELGVEGCVVLLGERADVRASLREANVGVIASDSEGLPLAMLEFMAEALPVVTTDVGQCAAVVRAAGCGSVVPPGKPEAMAAALLPLLEDREEARRLGLRGHAYVREHFGLEEMIRTVRGLYEGCMERTAAR